MLSLIYVAVKLHILYNQVMKFAFWQKLLLLGIFAGCLCTPLGSDVQNPEGIVYVVPVKGEIERGVAYFVNRCVKEAEESNAEALIIHMDTHGGDLMSTEIIMETLLDCPVTTYTFVDKKAFSAGAFIAAATKHIYMAEASVIGAATPVAMSPTGSAQDMGEAMEEKITSGVRALIATAAEKNGHPRKIVEAMVDRDMEIKGIIEKGKLLTLTNNEAEKKKIGLSEGTVKNLGVLIKKIAGENAQVIKPEISWAEKIARIITSSGIRAALLMLGLLGIYIEVKTPGFGIGGTAAIACFTVFFFGHYTAGLAGWEELLLFTAGFALLTIEIFVLPGFGIAGLLGITLILISFVLAMTGMKSLPGIPWWSQRQYSQAIYSMGMAVAGSIALAFLALKFLLPKTPFWGKISLESAETKEKGFTVTSFEKFLGEEGVSRTMLRPAGKAEFGEELLDVVTEGEIIPKGTKIRIIRVEGNRIVAAKND